jgi:hypothetical protein
MDGYLHVAHKTYALALTALSDVMAATGFAGMPRVAYVQAVVAEGPAFLRRLPGVTP